MNSPEKYHTVQKGRDLQGRETTQGYVPVIDISGFVPGQPRESPANLSLCDEVDAAFRQAGFFIATGHGVPPELLASAKRVCREFFSLSPGEKGAVAHPKKGFIPVGGCQNQVRSTSLHEKWSCGRVDGIDPSTEYYQNSVYFGEPNLWPQRPHDFEPTMTRYYKEMEALTLRLLSLTATALRLPHTFFDDKMDRHVTNLVALRYPPQVREPAPGEMRARPHTDPTALTVLAHDKEPGEPSGLEVLHDTMGSWEPIPVVAGGLVVNVGDLLHLWSGGEFRSAKHRVVNGADDRLTISYFAMPNYDATIAPVPTVAGADTFAPIRAGDISHFTQLKREEEGLEDPQLLENQVVKSTTSTSP